MKAKVTFKDGSTRTGEYLNSSADCSYVDGDYCSLLEMRSIEFIEDKPKNYVYKVYSNLGQWMESIPALFVAGSLAECRHYIRNNYDLHQSVEYETRWYTDVYRIMKVEV